MKLGRLIPLAVLVLLSCLPAGAAQAEQYVKPNLANLMRTIVRFGAMDLNDNHVIDSFARANECELFRHYFENEFAWQQIRDKLRMKMNAEVATYPTGYAYDTAMKLRRYNFDEKYYPFESDYESTRVNTFAITTNDSEACVNSTETKLLSEVKLVLQQPLQFKGLPLTEEEGERLFERMSAAGNVNHIVYARFNIRIVFIAGIDYDADTSDKAAINRKYDKESTKVRQNMDRQGIVFDSRLDSVEYFEDEARTKLIYIYRP